MARRASPKSTSDQKALARANPSVTAVHLTHQDPDHQIIVEVKSSEELWSTYNLEDGTVIRVKPVVAEFIRVMGEFNDAGEPLYLMKGGLVPSVRVPRKLLKHT